MDQSLMTLPQPSPSVVVCDVEGGAVLLSTVTETYFGLNTVGAKVWALLPQHSSIESLCTALTAEYPEVPLETLIQDISELLADLKGNGLVA